MKVSLKKFSVHPKNLKPRLATKRSSELCARNGNFISSINTRQRQYPHALAGTAFLKSVTKSVSTVKEDARLWVISAVTNGLTTKD